MALAPPPVERRSVEREFDPVGVLQPTPLLLGQVGAPLLGALLVAFVNGGFLVGGAGAFRAARRTR